jgi:dephospho-CoA kinase
MKLVGLTGSIGTGKSTVSKQLSATNFPIIDADLIAHQQAQKGTATFYETVAHFPDSLSATNEIDRAKLGAIIFTDPVKRSKLNSITHFWILHEMIAQVLYHFIFYAPVCILDIPLLFEAGLDSYIPLIILVYW